MALIIPPRVARQFAAAPREIGKRLLERLERVAADPFAHHAGVRPLVGRPGVFRVRQEDWRAVYSVEDGDVIVERIAHRKVAYR